MMVVRFSRTLTHFVLKCSADCTSKSIALCLGGPFIATPYQPPDMYYTSICTLFQDFSADLGIESRNQGE